MVVYPRWRGELDRTASVVSSGSGLSPLARGTPVFANLWTIAIRFIPAGAGNTGARNTKPCICSVYPRWRGEHVIRRAAAHVDLGLSPLARGTRRPEFFKALQLRFIPAGAGNTTVQTAGYYFFAVYPRWRGEHLLLELVECCYSGLSPLARGTQRQVVAALRGRRFIPAGAGNTYIRAKNKATATVYPRWRGEHPLPVIQLHCQCGLSPLARGTRCCDYCI